MKRSSNIEKAYRINEAMELFKKHNSASKAAIELAKQFNFSERQAKRYIQLAKVEREPVPIPDVKIAFTVKLSEGLLQKLRDYSSKSGHSLSKIVTKALETFL
jgi:hypothetical protein